MHAPTHTRRALPICTFNAAPSEDSRAPHQDYPLGGSQIEEQRLIKQAIDYEPHANVLLDRFAIQPGWNVVDIGCGPLGILHLLSERVGPHGHVVGVEREHRFVEMAQAEIARRGLTNVIVVQADALTNSLEKESFNLVHERLVTINVFEREKFIAELMSLLLPGGTVILEDVDNVSWLCQPAHPSWDSLLHAFHTVFQAGGGDPFVGRRLPELLRGAGAQDIWSATHVDLAMPGEYRRTHLISLIDSVHDKVLSGGLFNDEELRGHREALVAHLDDPETTVIDKLMVQAWGHKKK